MLSLEEIFTKSVEISLQFDFGFVVVVILQFQLDSAFGKVDVENDDLDSVAESQRVARGSHPRHVNEALALHAHVHEGAKVRHVRHPARQLPRRTWERQTL